MKKIPILLVTHNRPSLLDKVLQRLIKYTPWDKFDLWILDNCSTLANKQIIHAYKKKYGFINIYSQSFNQIAVIQNNVIAQIKNDLYIKLDDDILVTENWTKGFLGVFERNVQNISLGSVVMPINGYGWVPFINIMGLKEEFLKTFPNIELFHGCTEPSVWNNEEVNKYIWGKCLQLDKTSEIFLSSQNSSFMDYEVSYRYSIGAIIFSHSFWQKMGGWKVDEGFKGRFLIRENLMKLSKLMATVRNRPKQIRIDEIINIVTRMNKSALGIEEEHAFLSAQNFGLKQFVTSESIVYHFAFHPTESYLMENIFLEIEW